VAMRGAALMGNCGQRTCLPIGSGLESSWSHMCRIQDQDGEVGDAAMDDLDRLSLDVAIGILQAEKESPGRQKPAIIEIAEQILAELQPAEPCVQLISIEGAPDSLNYRNRSD
jgi:hypothetical protein